MAFVVASPGMVTAQQRRAHPSGSIEKNIGNPKYIMHKEKDDLRPHSRQIVSIVPTTDTGSSLARWKALMIISYSAALLLLPHFLSSILNLVQIPHQSITFAPEALLHSLKRSVMAPPSPTSPSHPPASPLSPRSPMILDIFMGEPLPHIMTALSSQQVASQGQSLFSAQGATPTSKAPCAQGNTANGSICRRNSLASPLTSPAHATFPPGAMSPVRSTFHLRSPERAYFQSLRSPTTGDFPSEDGRQSRLNMHNYRAERVMTLPLRVNTSLYTNSFATEPCIQEEGPITQQHQWSPSMADVSTLLNWSPPPSSTTSPTIHSSRTSRTRGPSSQATTRSPIRRRQQPRLHVPAPPKYHVTVRPTLSPSTARTRRQYLHSVEHLRAPLVPLISVSTGLSHPHFPTSLLQYHLLTHEQLDSLARWYHQVTPPVQESFLYPTWIPAWTDLDAREQDQEGGGEQAVDLETKRRRWGRFIGLRGCESPTQTEAPEHERPDELVRRMEREWRRALERADEEEQLWEKTWRGRW